MTYNSNVALQSISFRPDGLLEITFAEQTDITPEASLMKCIMFDEQLYARNVTELKDEIRELIDLVLAHLRGDKMTIPGRISK